MSMDFLPFTRPSIDEATIASVAEVLRSGWITSGPKVLEFEARSASRLWGSCEGAPRWLTLAETRVLNALMLGMTEGEAATAIGRSVSTVHDHVKAIHRKTGVSTRGELVARMSGTRQDQREAWVAGVTPR